ncbi:MAG: SRPBCC family protein [Gammaproteobacteria bacterium]|nr:SRPBCC family protein [Gammaproteobacteria bacterium]
MSFIKIIILAAIILAIGGIFLPQEYTVSRELVMQASAEEVHHLVEDMDSWDRWAAWDEAVPPAGSQKANMESGIGSGKYLKGASGSGWFVITNNSVVDGFEYAVYSDNGDKATANVTFLDLGGETKVTWTVRGSVKKPPVIAPYIALSKEFVLGSSLSQNLKNLKKKLTQADR